jgi:ribosome modulation factor
MKQLLLYTPAGWSLRDGRKAWRAGAGARAAGKPRKSPPQHGRLRTQWLAGWDAADQHIANLATQMGTQVAVAVQTQQVAMAVAPPASMRSRPVWGRGPSSS